MRTTWSTSGALSLCATSAFKLTADGTSALCTALAETDSLGGTLSHRLARVSRLSLSPDTFLQVIPLTRPGRSAVLAKNKAAHSCVTAKLCATLLPTLKCLKQAKHVHMLATTGELGEVTIINSNLFHPCAAIPKFIVKCRVNSG